MTENDDSGQIRCNHCGNPNIVGACPVVPVEELQALVDDLREKQYELTGANERMEGYAYAADELREVIDDYE